MNRRERIESLLRAAFAPAELDVRDESEKHRGHAGAAGGAGHFRVRLVSERFRGVARLARHRMVYDALAAEIGPEIHALALELAAPGETVAMGSGMQYLVALVAMPLAVGLAVAFVSAKTFHARPAASPTSRALRVVSAESDPALWQKIERELAPELVPDESGRTDPLDTYTRKRVAWVGVAGDAILARVEWRAQEPADWDTHSKVYSLPIACDSHEELAGKLWNWQMKLETVTPPATTSPPTVLFTALSCTECEPTTLLIAISLDEAGKRWVRLPWLAPEAADAWGLEADSGDGSETLDCAAGLLANERRELVDVGVWCRQRSGDPPTEKFTTDRLTRRGASYVRTEILDESQARELRVALCKHALPSRPCNLGP